MEDFISGVMIGGMFFGGVAGFFFNFMIREAYGWKVFSYIWILFLFLFAVSMFFNGLEGESSPLLGPDGLIGAAVAVSVCCAIITVRNLKADYSIKIERYFRNKAETRRARELSLERAILKREALEKQKKKDKEISAAEDERAKLREQESYSIDRKELRACMDTIADAASTSLQNAASTKMTGLIRSKITEGEDVISRGRVTVQSIATEEEISAITSMIEQASFSDATLLIRFKKMSDRSLSVTKEVYDIKNYR